MICEGVCRHPHYAGMLLCLFTGSLQSCCDINAGVYAALFCSAALFLVAHAGIFLNCLAMDLQFDMLLHWKCPSVFDVVCNGMSLPF